MTSSFARITCSGKTSTVVAITFHIIKSLGMDFVVEDQSNNVHNSCITIMIIWMIPSCRTVMILQTSYSTTTFLVRNPRHISKFTMMSLVGVPIIGQKYCKYCLMILTNASPPAPAQNRDVPLAVMKTISSVVSQVSACIPVSCVMDTPSVHLPRMRT